jgi:hypothetical protein
MRKLPLTDALLTACAVSLAAQEVPGTSASTFMSGVNLLSLKEYSSCFLNGDTSMMSRKYTRMATSEDYNKIAVLSGNNEIVDTPLEIALLSTCAGVIDIRPIEAQNLLPADPRTTGLKLGSAVLKELAELKFLDPSNTAAIGRYEGMIKYISDKNGVSRADIEDYLKQGIAAVVREKFNEVSFGLENWANSYDATLSYNSQTGVYTLSYGLYYTGNVFKTISGNGVDGLLAAMKNNPDFDVRGSGFRQVQEKAGHIPAVVYSSWVDKKMTTVDAVKLVADTVADFYLNPSRDNYDLLAGVYALILTQFRLSGGKDALADMAKESYYNALRTLSETLASRATAYGDSNIGLLARKAKEKDISYGVFSVPGAMGGGSL